MAESVRQDAPPAETVPDGPSAPGPVVIGPMRRRHLRGVAAVETVSSGHPWSLELFESELRQPGSRALVALGSSSEVVGFGCLLSTGFETHITNVAVHPGHRRRGVGRRLVAALFRETLALGLTEVTLEVRAHNTAAQELYRRFGFTPGGIRPRYYADNGEDALIMWATGIDAPEALERLARLELPEPGTSGTVGSVGSVGSVGAGASPAHP